MSSNSSVAAIKKMNIFDWLKVLEPPPHNQHLFPFRRSRCAGPPQGRVSFEHHAYFLSLLASRYSSCLGCAPTSWLGHRKEPAQGSCGLGSGRVQPRRLPRSACRSRDLWWSHQLWIWRFPQVGTGSTRKADRTAHECGAPPNVQPVGRAFAVHCPRVALRLQSLRL